MKQLGIIIVTYQSEGHIGPLLGSLAATVDPARTTILVLDNASTDATVAVLERENKVLNLPLRLLRSERNLGFTGANNQAFAALRAETPCEIIVLLNPDTVVHAGWWQPLVAALENPAVGTVSPLLLLPEGTVNSRGNALHFLGLGFVQGYGEEAALSPDVKTELFSSSGAALAFRTATLDAMNAKLGLSGIFWEDLFLYAEDTDLGWRMRLAGFDIQLVATSRVTHDHRFWLQTLDEMGDRLFWIERNRYLILFSNFKWATLVLLLPWILASEIALGLGLWKLYPHRLRLWRAIGKEVRSPGFRSRRRRLQAGRCVRDRDILRTMTGSIRHGALPFRMVDWWLDAGLRWSHRLLSFVIWW